MNARMLGFFLVMLAFFSHAGDATTLSSNAIADIQFDQKLGNAVDLNLQFTGEDGKAVSLRDFAGRKPVILLLGYYECPMLCSAILNGLVETMQDLKANAGDQFEIVNVSIDPGENPTLAAAKKRAYLKRYGHRGVANGWHFLTGKKTNIDALAQQIGFRYAYDPASKQFAHPSGFILLTPDGKISRYFFGASFRASELNAALIEARSEKIGSPMQQIFLLCFHYNPIRGKYGAIIMAFLRLGGFVTLAGIALMIIKTKRRTDVAENLESAGKT